MANFGSDTTWIKGTLDRSNGSEVTYFNLYQVVAVHQQNADDYLLHLHGGKIVTLYNCTQVDDLMDIEVPAAE